MTTLGARFTLCTTYTNSKGAENSRIIARYGCVESLQSDNGPHFVNGIITCLTETLEHHIILKVMEGLSGLEHGGCNISLQ